jgi:hypothetical protein
MFSDELAQITDESMRSMQHNVFAQLRPLEWSAPTLAPSLTSKGLGQERGTRDEGMAGGALHAHPKKGRNGVKGSQHPPSHTAAAPSAAAAPPGAPLAGGADAKPTISFACLIGMAIIDSVNQRLTVSAVYEWMKRAYPYFNSATAGSGWKNSVRHNLSLNKHFVKQVRNDLETGGKGSYWIIRPESIPIMEAAIRKQSSNPTSKIVAVPIIKPTPVVAMPVDAHSAYQAVHRPTAPARSQNTHTTPRRPHTFQMLAGSPTSETRDAAAALFNMTPHQATATGSFPLLSSHQRAWSAMLVNGTARTNVPRPPASAQPIRATYNPNAFKQQHRPQQQQSQFVPAGRPRASSTSNMEEDADMVNPSPAAAEDHRRRAMPAPATEAPKTTFTFSSPMSFSSDSRYTPESTTAFGQVSFRPRSNSIESLTLDASNANAAAATSPTSIRRRLAPMADGGEGSDGGGGMDCDSDDEQGSAVAALLGLGRR